MNDPRVMSPEDITHVEVRLNSILKSPSRPKRKIVNLKDIPKSLTLTNLDHQLGDGRKIKRRLSLLTFKKPLHNGLNTRRGSLVRFNDFVEVKNIDDIEDRLKNRRRSILDKHKEAFLMMDVKSDTSDEKNNEKKKIKKDERKDSFSSENSGVSNLSNTSSILNSNSRWKLLLSFKSLRTNMKIQMICLLFLFTCFIIVLLPTIFAFIFESNNMFYLSHILYGNVISIFLYFLLFFSYVFKNHVVKLCKKIMEKKRRSEAFLKFIHFNKNVGKTNSITHLNSNMIENGNKNEESNESKDVIEDDFKIPNKLGRKLSTFTFPLTDMEGETVSKVNLSPKVNQNYVTHIQSNSFDFKLQNDLSPITPPKKVVKFKIPRKRRSSHSVIVQPSNKVLDLQVDERNTKTWKSPSPNRRNHKENHEEKLQREKFNRMMLLPKQMELKPKSLQRTRSKNHFFHNIRRRNSISNVPRKRTAICKLKDRKWGALSPLSDDESDESDNESDEDIFKVPRRKITLKRFGNLKNIDNPIKKKEVNPMRSPSKIINERIKEIKDVVTSPFKGKRLKKSKQIIDNKIDIRKHQARVSFGDKSNFGSYSIRNRRLLSDSILLSKRLRKNFSNTIFMRSPKTNIKFQIVKVPKSVTTKMVKHEDLRRQSVDLVRRNSINQFTNINKAFEEESKVAENKLREEFKNEKVKFQKLEKNKTIARVLKVCSTLYDFGLLFFWLLNHLWIFVSLAFVVNSVWFVLFVPITLCSHVCYFIIILVLSFVEVLPVVNFIKSKMYDTEEE